MAETKRYFREVLKGRDALIASISNKLRKTARLGSAKTEKARVQTELASQRRLFRKEEQKFDTDVISLVELKERIMPIRKRISELETRLEAIENSPKDEGYIKRLVGNIYEGIDELLNLTEWTNAQLKRIVDKITISEDGAVTVYIKSLRRLGLEAPVDIEVSDDAQEPSNESDITAETPTISGDLFLSQSEHNGVSELARILRLFIYRADRCVRPYGQAGNSAKFDIHLFSYYIVLRNYGILRQKISAAIIGRYFRTGET